MSGNNEVQLNSPKTNTIPKKKLNSCPHMKNESIKMEHWSIINDHPTNGILEDDIFKQFNKYSMVEWKDDSRPIFNVVNFFVTDSNQHLCMLDYLDEGYDLYLFGYIEVLNKDISDTNSLPTYHHINEIGPITEWYFFGFDGKTDVDIYIGTEKADYKTSKAHNKYYSYMYNIFEKKWVSKTVIEYLEQNFYLQPTLKDLGVEVASKIIPEMDNMQMSESLLMRHAAFVCNQVYNLEETKDDEPRLITLPCIKELIKISGVKLSTKNLKIRKRTPKQRMSELSLATTTPTVEKFFRRIFPQFIQGDKKTSPDEPCGLCVNCLQKECGLCDNCKDMLQFGGSGNLKIPCVNKKCLKHSNAQKRLIVQTKQMKEEIQFFYLLRKFQWVGTPYKTENGLSYYDQAEVEGVVYRNNDFVFVKGSSDRLPEVLRIRYMWFDPKYPKMGFFHAQAYFRSIDTILGEFGNPQEVFLVDSCFDYCPLTIIVSIANVKTIDVFNCEKKNENNLFVQKYYNLETGNFEELPNEIKLNQNHRICPSCDRKRICYMQFLPILHHKLIYENNELPKNKDTWQSVTFRNNNFSRGSGVLLPYGIFSKETNRNFESNTDSKKEPTCKPFSIGMVETIFSNNDSDFVNPSEVQLKVFVMYRPEDLPIEYPKIDNRFIVWSNEKYDIPISQVKGKASIFYESNNGTEEDVVFYCLHAFDKMSNKLFNVPNEIKGLGKSSKPVLFTRKMKNKTTRKYKISLLSDISRFSKRTFLDHKKILKNDKKCLNSLDLFSGCGGLSLGLEQSGAVITKWAVEHVPSAAQAFQLNFPHSKVFIDDCNAVLHKIMTGNLDLDSSFPQRGEVDMICGGPPCQGWSMMNRFTSRDYSQFKNSLIVTFLSFCDYYRPKYIVMENVRSFATAKRGAVLKTTIACLIEMGYQTSFCIMQSGNFGVPQTRRRFILMCAAPGFLLSTFPNITHSFSTDGSLSLTIDNVEYNNYPWFESGPYNMCTIWDAISDLPRIRNGSCHQNIDYETGPKTEYQRKMRNGTEKLTDHICKNMSPLVQARIERIPAGGDWRSLPNISLVLSDGTKLEPSHKTKENNSKESRKTLTPQWLTQTYSENNNWPGVYGRLVWNSYSRTILTDPEPSSKQGRVLHPDQDRIISVRECARIQGFPDWFKFVGDVVDKHTQIGNAVPVPVAKALGKQIKKSFNSNKNTDY